MTKDVAAKRPHGGARPGAGRKPDAVQKYYVGVRMTAEGKEIFKKLGGSAWLNEELQRRSGILKKSS